jgi:tetratricopeptide (TPR) repeat protein
MKHRDGKGRRRTWVYKILALTLVPAFLLLSLEGGLRLFGYGYPTHFFVPAPNGKGYVVNRKFGWRFFPPNVTRKPPPFHLTKKKPHGSYRIFVLGGSAALGDPAPEAGFARMLEVLLEEQYADINFQVIPAAMIAINSHVVLDIAKDCADFDGDLFVVYMGNNEVVGPFGPSSVLLTEQPNRRIVRASSWLKSTRMGQLMADALSAVRLGDSDPGKVWRGMEMYLEHLIAAEDPRLEWVYDNFRDNLSAITERTLAAGAKTLVCTIPVNVRDNPPFASVHRPNLPDVEEAQWEGLYQEGLSLYETERYEDSAVKYREALAIDDRHAELHFRLAKCLSALGDTETAANHFLAALQLDALRFRADRRVNKVIREVSTGRESEGLHLLDLEKAFQRLPGVKGGLPGDEVFHEHVHLNFAGNYAVASALHPNARPSSCRGRHGTASEFKSISRSSSASHPSVINSVAQLSGPQSTRF